MNNKTIKQNLVKLKNEQVVLPYLLPHEIYMYIFYDDDGLLKLTKAGKKKFDNYILKK